MRKKTIAAIAEKTNSSRSTVLKVLNNQHGVSTDVRQAIYAECDRTGFQKKPEPVSIFVILPEIPQYFWGGEYPQPAEDKIKIKYNIYPRIGDNEIVMRYLHQAIALEARVIVISAQLNEAMRELLDAFSAHGLVIYLTEYNRTAGSVYVGGDAAEDGRQLARLCRQHIQAEDRLLLLLHTRESWGETPQLRYDAFRQVIGEDLHCGTCYVNLVERTNTLASLFARELYPLIEQNAYNKVICFTGITGTLCLAIQKMHLSIPVQCFGFEDAPQNKQYIDMGLLKGVVSQDFLRQLACALILACDFVTDGRRPEKTENIIPCRTLEY